MVIAVDFDGTIVQDRYPEIGKPMLFAFETLKELQKRRHQLVLWTYRSGQRLDEAVEFCKKNGIEFYAVNCSYPDEPWDPRQSRKINADLFIDDRNVGGFLGWGEVLQMIAPDAGNPEFKKAVQGKKGFFGRLFSS